MPLRRGLPHLVFVTVVATFVAALALTHEPRLISYERLPVNDGEYCDWSPDEHPGSAFTAASEITFGAVAGQSSETAGAGLAACSAGNNCAALEQKPPVHHIEDPYPSFSAVAVDPVRNEVVALDEVHFRVMVFDRLANTPAAAANTEPKRWIGGLHTHTQFASDVYIDPPTGEIYVMNNDTVHNTTVYGRQAQGDVPPTREFITPYGNFSMAANEAKNEMYLTVQHNGAVMVFRKNSTMAPEDHAIRLLQGTRTHMGDSHGIAFDPKNQQIFVTNWGGRHEALPIAIQGKGPRIPNWPAGNYHNEILIGTGKFAPPSITVFPADAQGNVEPLRIIEGPKAQMEWPTGVSLDVERGELYVANAAGDAITVFSTSAQGDVAPIRVLKGPHTLLKDPTDVVVDPVNDEVWVANFGHHMLAVYKRGASGDTAPVRMIRTAPLKEGSTGIGNPFSIAYDTKREQIIVPNCVDQPRIAAFARDGEKNAEPVRKIQGSQTGLHRTMHAVSYDAIHDEIVVPLLMPQAIATFRGDATGNEKPIRFIQGPLTKMRRVEKLGIDPDNNEILALEENSILVFDRLAQGNVAPKRILEGPDTLLGANNAQVDPVHNLLVTSGGRRILIFDRTASGNTKPLRVIQGPHTGLFVGQGMRVYGPTGKIVQNIPGRGITAGGGGEEGGGLESGASASPDQLANDGAHIAVWSVFDNGDVAPQWRIGGPKGLLRNPRGIAIDPTHKTIMASDKFLNAVLTYSLPEMFEPSSDPQPTARLDSR